MRIGWFLTTYGALGGVRSVIETGNSLTRKGHDFYVLGNVGNSKSSFCDDIIPIKNHINFNIYSDEESIKKELNCLEPFDLLFNQDPLTMSFSDYVESKIKVMHYCGGLGDCYKQFSDKNFVRTSCSKFLYEVSKKHDIENKYKKHFISQGVNQLEFYPKNVNNSIYKSYRDGNKINVLCCGSRGGNRKSNKGTFDIIEASKLLDRKKYNFIYFDLTKQDFPDYFKCIETIGNQKTLVDIYSLADIFIAPDYVSAFNCCCSEAMCCKKPVICSSKGVEDFAVDGENCLIFEENTERSPSVLAEKIETLSKDEKLRNNIAENGYKTILNFTWDNVANNIIEMTKEMEIFK